jgi:hypothetical protein
MGIGICWLADFRFGRANYPSTRAQVAPKVSEISGAIHKKYKTRAEAREAYNKARREGTVRAVPVDPASDTASLSDSSFLSVARVNCQRSRQQNCTQGTQFHERPHEREIVGRPIQASRPAARSQHHFQRKRAAGGSTHPNVMSPTRAGPSNFSERMDPIAVSRDEPRKHQNFNQESRNAPASVYDAGRSNSTSSRPVGPSTRGRCDKRWQGSQHGSVGALPTSSRADTSQAAIQSPGTVLSQSTESNHAMHRVSRLPQIDQGVPENMARTYGRPLTSPPAAQIGHADIESESEGSNSLSFYL